jgi:phosphoglycolate phosphatase-like HAD superfamily hydrolase
LSSIEDLTLLEARVRLASIHRSFLSRYGRNPLIGLDLDGTTADLVAGLREVMSSVWGLSDEERADPSRLPEPDKYAMWEGEKAWFKDKGEFLLHFRQAEGEGIYRTLPVYAEAGKTLRELKTSGFNITILWIG